MTPHDDVLDCVANFLDPDFMIYPTGNTGSEIADIEYFDEEEPNAYDYY